MAVVALLGLVLIGIVLWEVIETVVLPRTVRRPLRLTSVYLNGSWRLYEAFGRIRSESRRNGLLAAYAPVMLLVLFGVWAGLLILGFALANWGFQIPLRDATGPESLGGYLYFSGVTFFTLGFGDLTPTTALGRTFSVLEGGTGFGFLALVIGYVPVLYTVFSRRESTMLLLDSKAGSSPTAAELLRRHAEAGCMDRLEPLLKDWEAFAAGLLESYLSYPALAYYRSQHDHQSWLCSLTAVMDACALIEMGFEGDPAWACGLRFQASATFKMGRHLVVDLAYILDAPPEESQTARLDAAKLSSIFSELDSLGVCLRRDESTLKRLAETRELYEPYAAGLARDIILTLPEWIPSHRVVDNWQTSAWDGKHF